MSVLCLRSLKREVTISSQVSNLRENSVDEKWRQKMNRSALLVVLWKVVPGGPESSQGSLLQHFLTVNELCACDVQLPFPLI